MSTEDVLAGDVPAPMHEKRSFLDVRDLRVHFPTDDGVVKSVDGLSFQLERGKRLGIVGESGSGKSVTSLSIMGLHKAGAAKISGEIWVGDTELVSADAGDRAQAARQDDGDDLPGPAVGDAPVLHGRRADRRGVPAAPRRRQEGGAQAGRGAARPRRDPAADRAGSTTTRTSSPAACGSGR